jgi:alpha-N-arabinofuranosidase
LIVDGTPEKFARRAHEKFVHRISYFALHHYQPGPISKIQRHAEVVDIDRLTARDFWYAWVTVSQIDPEGQSVLRKSALTQARTLGYQIAVTEWNWNGWWNCLWAGIPATMSYGRAPFDSLLAKGIGAAGILHALMRQGDVVAIATQSMLVGDNWDIHAIFADRYGQIPPYLLPTGQVTMLYSKHHGRERLEVEVANMAYYDQSYRMGGISPAPRVAYLDILATREASRLFLHAINRHFDQALAVQFDISDLEKQHTTTGTLHIFEGRLNNEPAADEPLAPGRITEMKFPVLRSRFQVRLPARSVTVVEVPLQQ